MMFRRTFALAAALAVLAAVGCDSVSKRTAEPVDVSGTVKTADGKPVDGVQVSFFAMSDDAAPGQMEVKAGKFDGKLAPGKYTYFIVEGKSKAAFKAVPEQFKESSADRTIGVKSGTVIDIKLQ